LSVGSIAILGAMDLLRERGSRVTTASATGDLT
jgi:hypothetical protein